MKHLLPEPNVICAILLLAFLFSSCVSYYKTAVIQPSDLGKIDSLNAQKKQFILHNGASAMDMSDVLINKENNSIHCKLTNREVPSIYTPGMKKTTYIYNKTEKNVLNEVHFISKKDTLALSGANYVLPVNNIQRVDMIEKDKEKTKRSHIIGYSVLGVFLVFGIIIGASPMLGVSY